MAGGGWQVTYLGSSVVSNEAGVFQHGTTAANVAPALAQKLIGHEDWRVTAPDGSVCLDALGVDRRKPDPTPMQFYDPRTKAVRGQVRDMLSTSRNLLDTPPSQVPDIRLDSPSPVLDIKDTIYGNKEED